MKELRRNMVRVGALVVALFVALSGWFALTTFEQGAIWASSGRNTRLVATNAERGDIVDRTGLVLARTQDKKRVYLEDRAARRALAATLGDASGMSAAGVESTFSSELLAIAPSLPERLAAVLTNARRRGASLTLTVDASLTREIAEAFPSGYRGAVCVLNYRTGEVLSMVSLPTYDPAQSGSAQVEDTAYLNRCLQGLYAPGSVFKIVTLAAALENDASVLNETFRCSGSWNYGERSISCAGGVAHGAMSLQEAFAKSCNVTFGQLAARVGAENLRATAERMGYNENMKLSDFPIYNSKFPAPGSASDLIWSGIGQAQVLTTPMHVCMITAGIANGGQMVQPWLVSRITQESGAVTRAGGPGKYRQIVSPIAAQTIARAMQQTVAHGTANRAAISGHTVCGKTGSAEVSDDKSVPTNAWFTGFIAESDHPYAVTVVIERGGAGSGLAAQLGRTALAACLERERAWQ